MPNTKFWETKKGASLLGVSSVMVEIMSGNVIKATKYLSKDFIVRAVRKKYGKKFSPGNVEVILTIGKPNYAEREFIKKCIKAKEPFPVKKVQLKLLKK